MTQIIVVALCKGGTAKTTTAHNLCIALVRRGKRVLAIDVDPQCSLTKALDRNPVTLPLSVDDVLSGRAELGDTIIPIIEGLDLVPASLNLTRTEIALNSTWSRERPLSRALDPVGGLYDYVVIDTHPDISTITINALVAADSVLIPLEAEEFAVLSLPITLDTIRNIKADLNPRLTVCGILFTQVAKLNIQAEEMNHVRQKYGGKYRIFDTVISRSAKIPEAQARRLSIFDHAPNSSGAKEYAKLAEEIESDGDKKETSVQKTRR